MMSKRLNNSSQHSFESAQSQGTSNFVGTSARGYSGNAIPIMVSPDNGNLTCNGISPVAKDELSSTIQKNDDLYVSNNICGIK